ncbi:hypothetical protein OMR07_23830 [Methylobacterium organophilum]|nr:hypothetical protein AU375_05579 [Methylobacterium radiotolerans]MCX4198163.1 hypothetical protein [Methylobacterium organophilum]
MRIRFLRGRARARSLAAERIFARRTRIDTASAGASLDAGEPVDAGHRAGAEIVGVTARASAHAAS